MALPGRAYVGLRRVFFLLSKLFYSFFSFSFVLLLRYFSSLIINLKRVVVVVVEYSTATLLFFVEL